MTLKIMTDLIVMCKNFSFHKDICFVFSGANERDNNETPGIEVEGEEEFIKKMEELQKEIERLRESKAVVVKIGSPDIPVSDEHNDYFLLKFNSNFCLKEIKFL